MLQKKNVFFSNLDGLRFFAFLAVFINHASACLGYANNSTVFAFIRSTIFANGDLGVSFFFVLSGFLITYLLLEEKEIYQKINIKNFYIRRVLRIWPLYFFIVILCILVFPSFNNKLPWEFPIGVGLQRINPWFYITFTGNWDYLYNGISNVLIGVLWSVSVEEQFYLFWPLIITFIPKKHLLLTFISIIIGSAAFRFFFSEGGNEMILKYHSLSCVTYLAMGALIAHLATNTNFIDRIKTIPKYNLVIIYFVAFLLFPVRNHIWQNATFNLTVASVFPVVLALFFAFVILEQNYAKHSFYKISSSKLISTFGKFTYGMYCYHMLVFFLTLFVFHSIGLQIIKMNGGMFILTIITSLSLTILISKISYNSFESFFLKMKTKFSSI